MCVCVCVCNLRNSLLFISFKDFIFLLINVSLYESYIYDDVSYIS